MICKGWHMKLTLPIIAQYDVTFHSKKNWNGKRIILSCYWLSSFGITFHSKKMEWKVTHEIHSLNEANIWFQQMEELVSTQCQNTYEWALKWEKCIIHHFNPWTILFWPFEVWFYSGCHIQILKKHIFFASTFRWKLS